jgi:hypothetical protein
LASILSVNATDKQLACVISLHDVPILVSQHKIHVEFTAALYLCLILLRALLEHSCLNGSFPEWRLIQLDQLVRHRRYIVAILHSSIPSETHVKHCRLVKVPFQSAAFKLRKILLKHRICDLEGAFAEISTEVVAEKV